MTTRAATYATITTSQLIARRPTSRAEYATSLSVVVMDTVVRSIWGARAEQSGNAVDRQFRYLVYRRMMAKLFCTRKRNTAKNTRRNMILFDWHVRSHVHPSG